MSSSTSLSLNSSSGVFSTEVIITYFLIVVPVDRLWFPECRCIRDDLLKILMVNYIKIAHYNYD